MATSTFYRVLVQATGFDLTEHITRFTFEDCTDQDDLLKITLENIAIETVEKQVKKGGKLVYSWGYIGGAQSKQHVGIITGYEPDFGQKLTINITASDAGVVMKKNNGPKLHQGKTASQIARDIAKKHGLKADVQDTTKVYKSLPSGGRTDFELLRYLAGHEPGGQFRFMVKGETLHFTRIDLKKPSQRTFRWNDGSGNVLSFRPRENDSSKKAASAQASVPGMDPFTGKVLAGKAKDGDKNDPKLGTFRTHYNADGEVVGRSGEPPAKTIVAPAHDSETASAIASKEKKSAAMSDITANLNILGDPNLEADGIVSMDGVGPTFGGNWYLKKITHTLQGNTYYQCTCDLGRNATNKAPKTGAAKNAETNKTTGPDKTQKTKEVRVKYDQNSNRVN